MTSGQRGPQRRKDDFERDVSRWAYMLSVHRGKLLVLVSIVTWFLTTAGYRYVGPGQEMVILAAKLDTARTDIRKLQVDASRRDSVLAAFGGQIGFVIYNQCLQVRSGDRYAQAKCLANRKESEP